MLVARGSIPRRSTQARLGMAWLGLARQGEAWGRAWGDLRTAFWSELVRLVRGSIPRRSTTAGLGWVGLGWAGLRAARFGRARQGKARARAQSYASGRSERAGARVAVRFRGVPLKRGRDRLGHAWQRDAVRSAVCARQGFSDFLKDTRQRQWIEFTIECSGVTPLLQNKMPEEQLEAIRTKSKKKFTAPLEPRDEAARKLYLTNDTKEPYLPVENLMSCLIEAGKFIRLDAKRQMTNAKSTLLPGFLSINDFALNLRDPDTGAPSAWEVDMRQGRNPNGGEGVCILRPRFDRWSFKLSAWLDLDQLGEQTYRQLFDLAGSRIGLGDFRPQRKGIYGRFQIVQWKRGEGVLAAAE